MLTLEEDDIVRYRFGGKELKMQFVAPVTYMMTDAHLVTPAGTLPRAWRDGVAMGFQRWDSYRVVAGAKIVEQQWGGDSLQAMGLKIRVDPVTARVEWTESSKLLGERWLDGFGFFVQFGSFQKVMEFAAEIRTETIHAGEPHLVRGLRAFLQDQQIAYREIATGAGCRLRGTEGLGHSAFFHKCLLLTSRAPNRQTDAAVL